MREIELTQGQKALVDDEDFEWLCQYKWHAQWFEHTKSYYAGRSEYLGNNKFKTFLMAREIMQTPKGMQVDHINHDTLDNRKANLRNVTASQNNINRKIRVDNSTGFKGVSVLRGRFQASINHKYIGVFTTPEEASKAYESAAARLHGEFRYQP